MAGRSIEKGVIAMGTDGGFRKRQNPFTQVSNEALQNTELSCKARGLYAIIQSYITIPHFILYKNHLRKVSCLGQRAFDGAWQELKEAGYLKQYRIRSTAGYIYEYDLLDKADFVTPATQNIGIDGEIIGQ